MAFFKVQRAQTGGKVGVNSKTLYIVEADDATTARAVVAAQFEEDGAWTDVTAVDLTTLSATDFTGFRYVIKVSGDPAVAGDPDLVTAEYTGVSTNDLDAIGAGLVTALNAAYTAAMGGAVADDGGVFTDETLEARSAATGDMTLLPASAAQDDAYYFGSTRPFSRLNQTISQVGTGTYTLAWEFWNGTAWTALSNVTDNTTNWKTTGTNSVVFDRPTTWATTTVGGVGPLYWIRAVVDAGTVTQQPLGTSSTTQVAVASFSTPTVTVTQAAAMYGARQVTAEAFTPGAEEPVPALIGTITDGGSAGSATSVALDAQTAIPVIVAED